MRIVSPDLGGKSNQFVREIGGACDRIVGAGDPRILQTKVPPIARHGLELASRLAPMKLLSRPRFSLLSDSGFAGS
jgi:hypothetical protein